MKPRPRSSRTTGPKIRADRLLVLVDQHGSIAVEADHTAVATAHILAGAHDDGAVYVALLDASTRLRLLDRHHDDVADAGETTLGATQYLDALDALCAAVVRDVEIGLHLDHRSGSFSTGLPEPVRQFLKIQAPEEARVALRGRRRPFAAFTRSGQHSSATAKAGDLSPRLRSRYRGLRPRLRRPYPCSPEDGQEPSRSWSSSKEPSPRSGLSRRS